MPDRLTLHATPCPPKGAHLPLDGVTVLVVDDSRLACDGLRLMCRKLGARLRRADSLQAADLHLRVYRPDVVIVDLGLPDGRGEELIRDLAASTPRPVVLGLSGHDAGRQTALAAGADGFLDKPLESLAKLQNMLLALLPCRTVPALSAAELTLADLTLAELTLAELTLADLTLADLTLVGDPLALRDDLAYAAGLLDGDPDPDLRHYLAGFLGGVALQAHDRPLADAALWAQPKGLRAALNARLALPDQAFAQQGAPFDG
jgi:CheY-like chemotaxis protein